VKAEPGKDIWLFGGGALFRDWLHTGCTSPASFARAFEYALTPDGTAELAEHVQSTSDG
jgi:hypothetical protein